MIKYDCNFYNLYNCFSHLSVESDESTTSLFTNLLDETGRYLDSYTEYYNVFEEYKVIVDEIKLILMNTEFPDFLNTEEVFEYIQSLNILFSDIDFKDFKLLIRLNNSNSKTFEFRYDFNTVISN